MQNNPASAGQAGAVPVNGNGKVNGMPVTPVTPAPVTPVEPVQTIDAASVIAEMQKQIAALTAQVQQAKAESASKLKLAVSEKGGISVYGLGRFPMTAYLSQWEKIGELFKSGTFAAFIEAHRAELATKTAK